MLCVKIYYLVRSLHSLAIGKMLFVLCLAAWPPHLTDLTLLDFLWGCMDLVYEKWKYEIKNIQKATRAQNELICA
jgi:hypothetical protein